MHIIPNRLWIYWFLALPYKYFRIQMHLTRIITNLSSERSRCVLVVQTQWSLLSARYWLCSGIKVSLYVQLKMYVCVREAIRSGRKEVRRPFRAETRPELDLSFRDTSRRFRGISIVCGIMLATFVPRPPKELFSFCSDELKPSRSPFSRFMSKEFAPLFPKRGISEF